MTSRSICLLVGLLLAVVLIAGCGGSGGDGGSTSAEGGSGSASSEGSAEGSGGEGGSGTEVTTSSLSKAQFVKQGNLACSREKEELTKRVAGYPGAGNTEGKSKEEIYAEEVRALLIPTFEGEIQRLQELGAPAGEQQQIEALLAAKQKATEEVAAQKSLGSIYDVARYFATSNQLMIGYGLNICTIIAEPKSAKEQNSGGKSSSKQGG